MSRSAPHTARTLAALVVRRVLDEDAWTGPVLHAALAEHALPERDRALCSELARGTLRWAAPLQQSLQRAQDRPRKLDRRIRPHLLVAAYQLQHLSERIPARAAVHEAVEAVKRERRPLAGLANALLRNLGSAAHLQLRPGASVDEIAQAYGVPLPLAHAVSEGESDEDKRTAIAALNQRPPLAIWTAQDAEALVHELNSDTVTATKHPFVPGSILLEGAGDPSRLAGHQEGRFSVMDPGSAAVGLLARATGRVLDLCAAPGSKSLVLSALDGAAVTAVEQSERRAVRIQENRERTGQQFQIVIGDAADRTLDLGPPTFGCVLLDAPCSALGTTRRRPDVKLERASRDAEALANTQAMLLRAAADRVEPGGVLVYAVCSPLPDEGREIVDAFVDENADFTFRSAADVLPWLPADALDSQGAMRLRTHRHATDGFFAARLCRRRSTKH